MLIIDHKEKEEEEDKGEEHIWKWKGEWLGRERRSAGVKLGQERVMRVEIQVKTLCSCRETSEWNP